MRAYQVKVENAGATADGRLSAEEDSVRFYELVQCLVTAGITPDSYGGPDTDKKQLAQAIARYAAGGGYHGTDSGAANACVLTALGSYQPPKALFTGMRVKTRPANTNTTAATANVFGLGSKKILTWSGAALVGSELIAGRHTEWEYDATADAGAGAWLILPWTIALGMPFNITQLSYSNRAVLNGTGFLSFQTGTYTKVSGTSKLIVETSTNVYDGGIGAACAISRLNIASTNVDAIVANSDASETRPAGTVKRVLTGVAAGALPWTWTLGRNDGTTWRSIVNPTSASDLAALPAVTTSSLYISELE